jgi:hypothetical protein
VLKCPTCDKIKLVDSGPVIQKLKRDADSALQRFDQDLSRFDHRTMLLETIEQREKAAALLHENPNDERSARAWIAATFLISRIPASSGESKPNVARQMNSSAQIVSMYDGVEALSSGLRVTNGKGNSYVTEREVLAKVPARVARKIAARLGLPASLNDLERMERTLLAENVLTILDLVRSETISRTLKSVFHKRLLPHLNSSKETSRFHDAMLNAAGAVAFTLGPAFAGETGTLEMSSDSFSSLKNEVSRGKGKAVSTFFERVGKRPGPNASGLGYATIVKDPASEVFYVPYHSLFLLATATYAKSAEKSVGRAANYKGSVTENLIYGAVSAFMNMVNPKDGKKLLRYQLPQPYGDIDVGGFDEKHLLLIESKYWDAPTVESLEEELSKFVKRVEYVQENLSDLGFSPTLHVIPFFYTPYPPFATFERIQMVPSVSALIYHLETNYRHRPFKLIDPEPALIGFLNRDPGERLLAFDVSKRFRKTSPNKYWIHDAVFEGLDQREATLSVMVPSGQTMPIICEVSDKVAEELGSGRVPPGTVIRTLLYNLTGGWSLTQLASFKVLSTPNGASNFDAALRLQLASPNASIREFVLRNWGGKLATDILKFISRWYIDLPKLVFRLQEKGQNYLSGVGVALGMESIYDGLAQCPCGEIVGYMSDVEAPMRKQYRDGLLRCKNCDPSVGNKLARITGRPMAEIQWGALGLLAEREKQARHARRRRKRNFA